LEPELLPVAPVIWIMLAAGVLVFSVVAVLIAAALFLLPPFFTNR